MSKIGVIGIGFVGATTAAYFGLKGHTLYLYDMSEERRRALKDGRLNIGETEAEEALAGMELNIVDNVDELKDCDFFFVCVGTPPAKDGSADISHVINAVESLRDFNGQIIIKSTVPPGTTRDILARIVRASKKLLVNPEFLREGSALRDMQEPWRIVVGAEKPEDAKPLWMLYHDVECPKITTDWTTAEMIKYASNTMLASRIATVNELANICQVVGTDVVKVMHGVGLDPRIGPEFLRAGLGFGGSCLPKDVSALIRCAYENGYNAHLLEEVLAQNNRQPMIAIVMLSQLLGELKGKKVAILGVAFKDGTCDIRKTQAGPLAEALLRTGAVVGIYDPCSTASLEFSRIYNVKMFPVLAEALSWADACVIQTESREFSEPCMYKKYMKNPVVVDGRRVLKEWKGIQYCAVGLGIK